jgi:hypothetical protein
MQVCILLFFTHLLIASSSFSINKKMPTFSKRDCNASVYPPLLHSLIDSKQFFFHKQEDANIFKKETFHKFRKEATNQVHSCLPSCQTGAKAAGATGTEL